MATHSLYLFFWSLLVLVVSTQMSSVSTLDKPMGQFRSDYAQLLDKIYKHRAVENRISPQVDGHRVNITVDLFVKRVSGVDELSQKIETFVHFLVSWHDPDFMWSPQDYGGVETVHLDKDKFWYPALNVLNAGDMDSFAVDADRVIGLNHNGTARYRAAKFLTSTCELDLTEYPEDIQNCQIHIVSAVSNPEVWIQHGSFIEEDEDRFQVKSAWKINKSMEVVQTPTFSFITVHLRLRRQALFYTVCLLLPMFATSLLTVFVFWVSPQSGEKVSFLLSIVLANTVLLNLLGGIIPHSIDHLPKCLLFTIGMIAENFLAFICTLIVLRKYEHEQKSTDLAGACTHRNTWGFNDNVDEPCPCPEKMPSADAVYLAARSYRRALGKRPPTVGPEPPSAAAEHHKVQLMCCSCVPCRSKQKWRLMNVFAVPARTLDKIFFVIFLLAYVGLSAYVVF